MHRPHRAAPLLPLVALLAACSGSSSAENEIDPLFFPRSTDFATAASSPVTVDGAFFAYLASESTSGQGDLNGDLDAIDEVASFVDVLDREETLTGIAAEDLILMDQTLFLVVNEENDGRDWDSDGLQDPDELSLVYWRVGIPAGRFVTRLDPDVETPLLKASATSLFAVEEDDPGAQGVTNLILVPASNPELFVNVTTDAGGAGGLRCELHGADEGLVIVTLDETVNGDLNGDGDGTDPAVLALLDGTTANRMLHSTGYAVDPDGPTVRAYDQGSAEWLVAFLVDEAFQPEPNLGQGFNNRDLFPGAWEPDGCPGATDTDTTDQVLFFLDWNAWIADPVDRPIRNTGLVGRDRVVVVDGHVGVVSHEADDGGCDLNGDGDSADRMLRWVEALLDPAETLLPNRGLNELLALVDDIPGGTRGVAEVDDAFVVLVDEEADDRNHDDSLDDETLLAWLDPALGGDWDFDQATQANPDPIYASASWMSESPGRTRLLWAGREEVFDENLNIPDATPGADQDLDDSVPLFSRIDRQEDRLTLPFVRIALDRTNAGMVLQEGVLFSRFYEAEDTRDLNDDGDRNDWVVGGTLIGTPGTPTAYLGGVAGIAGRPAVDVDPFAVNAAAGTFLARESDDRRDYNNDGDQDDIVVRYFRF